MLNQLPAELKDEMQEHLRLKFNHQEASDDQVGWNEAHSSTACCLGLGSCLKRGGSPAQQPHCSGMACCCGACSRR